MNTNELKTILEENHDKFHEFCCEDYEDYKAKTSVIGGLTLKSLEHERMNSEIELVFQIGEQYFAAEGTYDSWEGTDYSETLGCLREVKPEQKTITVYTKV